LSAVLPRALVFAYHNVGVRCLRVLLAHGVEVVCVVSHEDRADEQIWFDSVARVARECGLPLATPDDPNTPLFVAQARAWQPDYIFSFYYRQMLGVPLLACAARGAYNMHGSLLPKYRGRVPVNWAVIRGERETGATLHQMVSKPDAGAIVAQQAVPILPDDSAVDVFIKVTVAAELALDRVLPALLAGAAEHRPQDLAAGSYFGGRRAGDGRIDWGLEATSIHNLVRGVAPPYPGAITEVGGRRARILRSRVLPQAMRRSATAGLYLEQAGLRADCGGGGVLQILALEIEGQLVDAARFEALHGGAKVAVE